MRHPYYHALSTVKRHGGTPEDYLAVHSWFDQTKAHIADSRHRLFLHNPAGIALAVEVFGEAMAAPSVREIGEQHITEDFGHIPSVERCLSGAHRLISDRRRSLGVVAHGEISREKFGGAATDYEAIHYWFTRHGKMSAGALALSSLGVFLAEQCLGVVWFRPSDGKPVPLRAIAEAHVLAEIGSIPSLVDYAAAITMQPWMMKGARSLSKTLQEA